MGHYVPPLYILIPLMRKLAFKITVLFLLLTATLCAAVGFVVHSARLASGLSEAEQAVATQRQATDRLMYALLTSSTQAESATLQYAENMPLARYLKSVGRTDSALENLRALIPDSGQRARLDTLRLLVRLRSQSVLSLVDALRRENGKGSPLQRQIDELRSGRKPINVGAEVASDVVEHGEQVVIHSRKKGFFRRLADAFRKGKDDTVSVSTVTREHPAGGTRTQVNITDTLADILTDVHRDITQIQASGHRRIARHSDALRLTSSNLAGRIVALLTDFSRTQRRQLADATQHDLADRRGGAWQMGALALLTTAVALALFVWVWRDMLQAIRYRRALEEANHRTQELMKRREQLLLTISHDIKAPVNTILGYLALIRQQSSTTPSAELSAIESSAHHLLQLVMALLDYHKLEAGEIHPTIAPVDIQGQLADICLAFRPMAEKKGLELAFISAWPKTGNVYLTDAFRLRQIIENLLSNAIKYTRTGSVSLKAEERDGSLFLSVTDSGCGLSAYDCERIFEPFTRVKGSEGQEGTGLGLSITRQLALLLGGDLSVNSELGQGSTFTLRLPARHSEVSAPKIPVYKKDSDLPQAGRPLLVGKDTLSVAVLDDDRLQMQLALAMLRNVLPTHATIHSFDEAEALLGFMQSDNRPDILFTDIEMPGLTGFEVRQRVHALPGCGALPVIAMTSHTLLPPSHFTEQGFAAVIFKPFTQNGLRDTLQSLGLLGGSPVPSHSPLSSPVPSSGNIFSPLLTFASGDQDAERKILVQFQSDCLIYARTLDVAARGQDKTALCQAAHKLLPTFTLIQSPVVPMLRSLEARRGQTDWSDADATDCRRILEEVRRVTRLLKEKLSQ